MKTNEQLNKENNMLRGKLIREALNRKELSKLKDERKILKSENFRLKHRNKIIMSKAFKRDIKFLGKEILKLARKSYHTLENYYKLEAKENKR